VTIGCRFCESILLVDVVTYSGERDLLQARLDILQPDICLVVESDAFFTGGSKRLTFQDNPVEGVQFVPHVSPRFPNAWDNEFAQRRAGHNAVKLLEVPGDAVVGFFDVDEFPDPVVVRELSAVTAWRMAKYQMSLHWYQQDELTGVSGRWSDLVNQDIAAVRQQRVLLPSVDRGWHFSSFLTVEGLREKWAGFSHTELVRANMDDWVQHCWTNGLAVENGTPMFEVDDPEVPGRMWDGPEYWARRRP